jgi:hypothetical protein
MQHLRRHHHAFVRLALVAMLALACVPTLSRWLATAEGPLVWAQVCTPQGMKSLGDSPAAPVATQHLDACGFCTLAPGAALPAVESGWRADAPVDMLPLHASTRPPAPTAWTAAQPRAPPALS